MSGIGANAFLATVKGVAGVLGNSYALVADAIESASDVVSSIIVLLGIRVAAAPLSEGHPYGKGRAEPLAAIAVSVALFIAAASIAISSIGEIKVSHHAPAPFTLAVLLAVIVVKEMLFRYVFKVGEDVSSIAVKSDAWHHRSDAITSAAAFIGISIALIGGRGFENADDWAALVAAVVIAINATNLAVPALRELTDASPNKDLEDGIRRVAQEVPGVLGSHKCFVRKVGFDYFVDLDVLVDGSITVKQGHDIAHRVQDHLRQELPMITRTLIHVEPIDEHGRRPLFG